MKKNIVLLLWQVCVALLPATGQDIIMSEDIPLRGDVSYELLGEFKGRVLLFRNQVTKYEVQGFDQRLRTSWSKFLTLDKKSPRVLGLTYGKNDFTLLYHFREQNNTILKAAKFDPGANMIDSVTIKNFGYIFFTPEFEMVLSEDRSKVLVYYVERQAAMHAFVFDTATFRLLWEKVISPAGISFWEDFRQVLVDNDGNLYLILETNRFLVRREGHNYQIIAYLGEDNRLVQHLIPFEGKLTYDVRFGFDNLNYHLVAAGLYAEKVNDRASGYFMLRIDPAAEGGHFLAFEPFDDAFVSSLVGKEVEKNRGVAEISIKELVLRRDGGVLLVAERIKSLERRLGSPNRVSFDGLGRFILDYYYDEIIAISIHPDGHTHWKVILPKKQYSQDDGGVYSSFFLFKTPGSLRFLFNDEIRFENTVSQYVLKGNGAFDRNSLLNTEKQDIRLRFQDALQISANEVIVPSERRNRLRLVKMVF